ncbi:hypothetical protein ACX0G9_29935 [Flavitalea flava]
MSQPFDILRRLQDYELPPPPEVVAGLRNALKNDQQGSIERVGQLEIAPPAFIRASIENKIGEKSNLKRSLLKIVSIYPYRAIAACLIFAVGVWLIYRTSHLPSSNPLATTNKTNAPLSNKPLSAAPNQDGANQGADNKDSASENKMAMNSSSRDSNNENNNGFSGSKTVKIKPFTSFSLQGQGIPVVDNDLLVTFASFSYEDIPVFLTGTETRDLKIHVDQYTNVVISRAMAATMKEMYQVRSGGKPTRKARKTRSRLEDWKKKDMEHFDQTSGYNPLDPIDLARFIFK